MNDIEKRLRELEQERETLLTRQRSLAWEQQRIEKKARASHKVPTTFVNCIKQTIVNGDRVVAVRGGGHAKIQPVVGEYIGLNVSPMGETRSVRVKIEEDVTVWIDANGKQMPRTHTVFPFGAPSPKLATRKIIKKPRIIAVSPNRVFAIRVD